MIWLLNHGCYGYSACNTLLTLFKGKLFELFEESRRKPQKHWNKATVAKAKQNKYQSIKNFKKKKKKKKEKLMEFFVYS